MVTAKTIQFYQLLLKLRITPVSVKIEKLLRNGFKILVLRNDNTKLC